jgi:hypothetical protein
MEEVSSSNIIPGCSAVLKLKLSVGHDPEPDPSIPTCFSKVHFNAVLQSLFWSSKWPFFKGLLQHFVCISCLPLTNYMHRPKEPQFHYSNNTL